MKYKVIILFLLIVILILSLAIYQYQNEKKETLQDIYIVGDTANIDGLYIKLNSIEYIDSDLGLKFYPWANLFNENNRYIIADFIIENNSDKNYYISRSNFSIYDDMGYNGATTKDVDVEYHLSGSIGNSRKIRGQVVFVVHTDSSEWEILYEGKTVFKINKNDF